MVACIQKLLSFLSSAFSVTFLCGPSVESLYTFSLKCGLRDVRLYIWLSLIAIIYYILYMQVKEAFTFSSVTIVSEIVSRGPSDVSRYKEWSAVISCGLSDGRSLIFSMIFLLLYDQSCNIGIYLLYLAQQVHMLMYWWCGGGCKLRPSCNLISVGCCFSAMAAIGAVISGFTSCFNIWMFIRHLEECMCNEVMAALSALLCYKLRWFLADSFRNGAVSAVLLHCFGSSSLLHLEQLYRMAWRHGGCLLCTFSSLLFCLFIILLCNFSYPYGLCRRN